MKKRLVVTDWSKASLLFSDVRVEILDWCGVKPHSIKDLSVSMGATPGMLHNHVKKLYEAGFLDLVETRMINGIEEKKYAKSAEFIDLSHIAEEDLPKRNEKVAHDVKKNVLKLLSHDRGATVKRQAAYLNQDDVEYVREELARLREFVLAHQIDPQEGSDKCLFLYAIGIESTLD